jgi:hypothetical protein
MGALTKDRNTPAREGGTFDLPALAAAKVYAGGLAVLDADGWCKPAVTALALTAIGRFEAGADNTDGANGALNFRVRSGRFRWANSEGGDEITQAEIGDACYIVDDQTVAKTDGGGTRSRAGVITDVDAQGVWVLTGVEFGNGPAAALLPGNNLSDLGAKSTSRDNLGVYEKMGAPSFVIGAEAGNVINVAVQLKDSAAVDLAVRGAVVAYLSDDANGDSVAAAAPDGGVAIGADGVAIPLVADKAFQLVSEADGNIDLDITHAAGAKTLYLVLVMPDGRLVASDAITFA